ncbi:restriction endonuclease subunit S [Halomonas sp. FeN2]|uniref:restriction endonuclease subunit S n=1 Tax=Halomonas sp. FeN2 TaxID=2832500 RepID=UPI000C5041C6|nr:MULTISPECIES: restriction endonuclease subunit S [unclassified Halomonas]MBF57868.1 type I restriction endonuclease [Halomonas sp.]UBR48277.1 restriction endonuclease subunit S [Halomonas sp. FeN2]|tara:strand:+ start:1976 stop:3226 length:1251 start_codon:yes stop_codon:yes gene_type:complete
MSSWTEEPLELCLEALIDYRGKSPKKSPTGIPVLSAKVVKTSGLLRPIEQTISPQHYKEWMTRGLPQPGDVVMTTEAPMGEVIQLDEETSKFALGQRIVCLRGKQGKLDNTFLRYLLTSRAQQDILASRATGTTVLGISQKALRSMPIRFPKLLDEQKSIGMFLVTLDTKIELNQRMNETLEAMARAVFQDWFVDFGPTRRKAAGETDPVAILGRLFPDSATAAPIAALFPNDFGDDGLPQGWELERVDQYLELAYGKALTKKNRVDGDYPVYGSGGIIGTHNAPLATGPAIIIGRKGTVGSLYWEDRNSYAIDTVFYVIPKTRLSFLYYLLQTLGLGNMNTDAAVPGLNRNNVYRLERSFGCDNTRKAFADLVDQFRALIRSNSEENQTLAATRDLLLPKLMSGEIRLKNAEGVA